MTLVGPNRDRTIGVSGRSAPVEAVEGGVDSGISGDENEERAMVVDSGRGRGRSCCGGGGLDSNIEVARRPDRSADRRRRSAALQRLPGCEAPSEGRSTLAGRRPREAGPAADPEIREA